MSFDEDAEQVREVFAQFGLAMYEAQCLEHGLVNALVYLDLVPNQRASASSASEWEQLVDSFMDSKFDLTLGRLIGALRKIATVDEHLEAQLASALAMRNWLAHHYFRERAEAFPTRAGRSSMIVELETTQKTFKKADEALGIAVRPARLKIGLTDEALDAAVAQLRAEIGD